MVTDFVQNVKIVDVGMKFMDNKTINAFSTKDNIIAIYKLESTDREYWLVVEDVYSQETEECYNLYYELLDDTYFELRIISKEELTSLLYIQPEKVYGGKECQ